MGSAVRADRIWFKHNPSAIVRFRKASRGEFHHIIATGSTPPEFRPSICKPDAPLRWVAVVDLMRLAGESNVQSEEPTLRLRLRIPAIRSLKRQKQVTNELLEAIAEELLTLITDNDTNIAA
tara:strand:+ start:217 stop:582 length:366 start_codon:yes stop_codon:yes gene_type:complete